MLLIDLRHTSRERAGVNNELHARVRCVQGFVAHRVTQAEMIDDDVHETDATRLHGEGKSGATSVHRVAHIVFDSTEVERISFDKLTAHCGLTESPAAEGKRP